MLYKICLKISQGGSSYKTPKNGISYASRSLPLQLTTVSAPYARIIVNSICLLLMFVILFGIDKMSRAT